ncbi:MAG: hypothetical protein ACI8RD_005988, partial [Bacillariaceae sp.]
SNKENQKSKYSSLSPTHITHNNNNICESESEQQQQKKFTVHIK